MLPNASSRIPEIDAEARIYGFLRSAGLVGEAEAARLTAPDRRRARRVSGRSRPADERVRRQARARRLRVERDKARARVSQRPTRWSWLVDRGAHRAGGGAARAGARPGRPAPLDVVEFLDPAHHRVRPPSFRRDRADPCLRGCGRAVGRGHPRRRRRVRSRSPARFAADDLFHAIRLGPIWKRPRAAHPDLRHTVDVTSRGHAGEPPRTGARKRWPEECPGRTGPAR